MRHKTARDEDGVSSSPLLTSLQQFLASGRSLYTTQIHVRYIWKLAEFLQLHPCYVFLSPEPRRPRLKNCPDYIFSLHQTSIFYLALFSNVFLLASPSLSLSSKTPFKSPRKYTVMTLTSQFKWHIGYNLTTHKFEHYDKSLNQSSITSTNYLYYNP